MFQEVTLQQLNSTQSRMVFSHRWLCYALLAAGLQLAGWDLRDESCARARGDINAATPAPMTPEEFLFQRDRLSNLVFRVPEHRELQRNLSRATTGLQSGQVAKSLTLLQSVLDQGMDSGFLVTGGMRQLSVRTEVLRLLSSLPVATRRTYDQMFDGQARALLDEARQSQRPDRFALVAHRYFHTQSGFAAVRWLASRWLDRGRYAMAAGEWERLLSDSVHRRRVTDMMILKAAIANQLSGNHEAALELVKRLAGRQIIVRGSRIHPELVLARVAQGRQNEAVPAEWRMLLGDERRNANAAGSAPFLRPIWSAALTEKTRAPLVVRDWQNRQSTNSMGHVAVANFPLVIGEQVVVRDFHGIRAFDLKTGKTRWRYRSELTLPTIVDLYNGLFKNMTKSTDNAFVGNSTWGMLSSDGHRVFAVEFVKEKTNANAGAERPSPIPRVNARFAGPNATSPTPLGNRLIALQIADDENAHAHELQPLWSVGRGSSIDSTNHRLDDHYFLGGPLPIDGQLLVLTESDKQINLVSLDAASGQFLWSQGIALAPARIFDRTQWHRYGTTCSPAFADGIVVCPTGLGTLVAVDLSRRSLMWTYLYHHKSYSPRTRRYYYSPPAALGHVGFANVPQIRGERAVFLPRHSKYLHCLDVRSGKRLWQSERNRAEYVAALTDEIVLVVGEHYTHGLRLDTGVVVWSVRTGMPSGRGVRIGQNYLLPLKQGRVANIDIATGRETGFTFAHPTQNPMGLDADQELIPAESFKPANLVAHDDVVVSLGPHRLSVYPQAHALLSQVDALRRADAEPTAGSRTPSPATSAQAIVRRLANSDTAAHVGPALELLSAELDLTLGGLNRAERRLDQILTSARSSEALDRARMMMRELQYARLREPQARSAEILQQIDALSVTPSQQGRFLVHKAEWQLTQNDPLGVFNTSRKVAKLELETELATSDAPYRFMEKNRWVASILGRLPHEFRQGELGGVQAQIDQQRARVLDSDNVDEMREFLAVYSTWTQSEPVRNRLARRLLDGGYYQEAELLLLQNRDSANDQVAAAATELLIELWNEVGLHLESARLLSELNGRFAEIPLPSGRSGREFVARYRRDSQTWNAYHRAQSPDWPITHVTITEHRWIDSDPDLQQSFSRYRRRFATPPDCQFHLLDKGSNLESKIAIIDESSGVTVGNVRIPVRHSFPTWSRNQLVGHLVPVGSPSSMHAVSLLERDDERPYWEHVFAPIKQSGELPRVGPAGPEFCTFQTQKHLICVHPASGRVLWRRTDLDPDSGFFIDSASGLFGDSQVLVMFVQDRTRYTIYDTVTGQIRRRGVLDVDTNYPRRVFGRKLFYISKSSTDKRMRIWDPLHDRIELDEPLEGRLFAGVAKPGELFLVSNEQRLLIRHVESGQKRLDYKLIQDAQAQLTYVRVFSDQDHYYLNLQRPTPIRRPPVYSRYTNDTLLRATQIQGELTAVDRKSGRVLWQRTFPQRTFLQLNEWRLPFLIAMSRVQSTYYGKRQSMLVEVIDAKTGETIGIKDNILPDRIVNLYADLPAGRLELRGLMSRIEIEFSRTLQRLPRNNETL